MSIEISTRCAIEALLKEILKCESIRHVDFTDNFFQLGLDSLQLATFELKLTKQYSSLNLLPGFCYQNFSPQKAFEKLCEIQHVQKEITKNLFLHTKESYCTKNSIGEINITNNKIVEEKQISSNIAPLSHAQRRIWFLCYNSSQKHFTEEFTIQLPTTCMWDRQCMIIALNTVILWNKILRSGISQNGTNFILYSGTESFFALPFKLTTSELYKEHIDITKVNESIPLRFGLSTINGTNQFFHAKFHSILVDGKSVRIFMQQLLLALYNPKDFLKSGYSSGEYFEFLAMEKQFMQSKLYLEQRNQSIKFWQEKLSTWENQFNCISRNHLVDNTEINEELKRFNFIVERNKSGATKLYNKLKILSERNSATILCTMVTILRILLYKMFGIDDIIFGLPVEKRQSFCNSKNFSHSIGIFLNLCIAREKVNAKMSIEKFISQSSKGMIDLLNHSLVPFDEVIAELRKTVEFGDVRGDDLFQIVVIQDTSLQDDIDELKLENLELSGLKIVDDVENISLKGAPQYPMMWHFIEEKIEKKLKIQIHYDSRYFSATTINTLSEKYSLLCQKIVENSTEAIETLNLMNDSDLQTIVGEYEKNCQEYPAMHPITGVLSQLVQLPPTKIVVEDGYGQQITARQLNNTSRTLGTIFQSKISAVKKFDNNHCVIAFLHKRNANLIPLILGSWIADAIVLPISNDWPTEKIVRALKELPFDVILVTDREEELWPNQLFADTLLDQIQHSRQYFLQSCKDWNPHKFLYLTFTSGSTGRSKVVATRADGLMNFVKCYTDLFNYNSNSIVYQVVNYSFDIFFGDLLVSLINGSLLLLAKDMIPCTKELSRCTHAYVMPSYLSQLNSEEHFAILANLQVLQFGGESISRKWLLRAVKSKVKLVQLFGLTETTIYSAYQRFATVDDVELYKNNIGTPFSNICLFLVDNDNQLIPPDAIGVEGRLCIGGHVSAESSYICNGDNKKFNRHALLKIPFFQTSDRVLINENKDFQFLGRSDQIVKIRGNLIDPLELEQIILKFTQQISNCAVVVNNDRLIAFLQFNAIDNTKEIKKIKSAVWKHFEENFPRYIVPSEIVVVQEFKLNSNGKIDRKALQIMPLHGDNVDEEFQFTSEIYEFSKDICKIFAQNLGVESIVPNENLFNKGADSLHLLMAIQQVENECNIRLSIDDIFKYKTIELVLHKTIVDNGGLKQNIRCPITLKSSLTKPNFVPKMIPLSYNQEHLWLLNSIDNDDGKNDAYLILLFLQFSETPKLDKLSFAINSLIQTNSTLRTIVALSSDGNPYQEILSSTESYLNLSIVLDLMNQNENPSININTEIPIKLVTLKSADMLSFRLILHHIAVDGASLQLIVNRISEFYINSPLNADVVRKTDSLFYVMYSLEQRSKSFQDDLSYWNTELASVKNSIMPNELTKKIDKHFDSKMDQFIFKFQISQTKLQQFLKKYSCSVMQTLLAAYVFSLSKEILNSEITIGTVFANRTPKNKNIIGYFAMMHALHFSLDKIDTVKNLINHVRDQILTAASHSHIPFELVVQKLKPKRRFGFNPIFQRVFLLEKQNKTNNLMALDNNLSVRFHEEQSMKAKFDQCWRVIDLNTNETESANFELMVEFNHNLFNRSTIENAIYNFHHNLLMILNESLTDEYKEPIASEVHQTIESLSDIIQEVNLIWLQVLEVKQIENDENFFEIGGHSLLANRICKQIRERICVDCRLSDLFKHQTINELSNILYDKLKIKDILDSTDDKFSIENNPTVHRESEKAPCCLLQNQLLNIYKSANAENLHVSANHQVFAYTILIKIQLSSDTDLNRLKSFLESFIARHSSFRTVFDYDANGNYFQSVLPIDKAIEQIFGNTSWNTSKAFLKKCEVKDSDLKLFNPFREIPLRIHINPYQLLQIELSHLIFDGTSTNVLIRELHNYYGHEGLHSTRPNNESNYIEFSKRFNALCKNNFDKIKAFWLKLMESYNQNNHIITDHPRVAFNENYASTELNYTFNNLNKNIGKICRELQIMPLTISIFALSKLIQQRMSSFESNFFIGTVKDMRDIKSLDHETGFFVNTLPIPIMAEIQQSTSESLLRLNNLIDCILNDYCHITYDQLLNLSGSESLFDVMIVIDNSNDLLDKKGNPLEFEVLESCLPATKFAITIFVSFVGAEVNVRVEFLKNLFDKLFIDTLIEYWADMIRRLGSSKEIDAVELFIDKFAIEGEKNAQIYIKNESSYCIDIFETIYNRAKQFPETFAIQTSLAHRNICYGELPDIIDSLSAQIIWQYFSVTGELVTSDTLIAILGRRNCVQSILLSLAVMRANGAYLPIDAENTPKERIDTIFSEANVKFCISIFELLNPPTNAFIDSIYHYASIIRRKTFKIPRNVQNRHRQASYDLAYVIFTSGTTGVPKGAAIERHSVINAILEMSKLFEVSAGNCIYQFTNFCFDNSVLEIFLALFNGARLFIDDIHNDNDAASNGHNKFFCAKRFCEQVDKFAITHVLFFPALIETFDDDELRVLSKCKYWMSGAEKLPKNLMERALKFGVRIIQTYGPTECTCYLLSKRMNSGDHPQNLGYPLANTRLSVRTPSGHIAMPCTSHQLYASGMCLTRGYLNRPNNEQPFTYFDGIKYYYTGDIVQQLPNGEILFIGRVDNQLKIRGFRVEAGDIEAVLMDIPVVKIAKVIADPNQCNDLIAYFTLHPNEKLPSNNELRHLCRLKLPYFMIPRFFIPLDYLPMTANSKIDIKSLPKPSLYNKISQSSANVRIDRLKETNVVNEHNGLSETQLKPFINCEDKTQGNTKIDQNEKSEKERFYKIRQHEKLKQKILETFQVILTIPNINEYIDESFVYLGGNSLNGQRIINQLNSDFQLKNSLLDLNLLLNANTVLLEIIEHISQIIEENGLSNLKSTKLKNGNQMDLNNEWRIEDYSKIPLSFQQEQMYYLSQIDSGSLYVLPLAQKFSINLDIEALHSAFMYTISKHAALRTIIAENDDNNNFHIFQNILSLTESFYLSIQHWKREDFPQFTEAEIQKLAYKPFNLTHDLPVRLQLFKNKGEYVLILLIHHIALDATSTQLLEIDIMSFYNCLKSHITDTEKTKNMINKWKPNAYARWSIEQKLTESQIIFEEKAEILASKLFSLIQNQVCVEEMFCRKNTETNFTEDRFVTQFSIPFQFFKKSTFTPYTFIITAFIKTFVAFISTRSDLNETEKAELCHLWIIIGSPSHNRQNRAIENVIGNFLNNIILALPLSIFMDYNQSNDHLIETVHEEIETAMKYRDVPFSKIIDAMRKKMPTFNSKCYSIYVNCRYDLENEMKLSNMNDIIIDHKFNEKVLKLFNHSHSNLNHFIELDLDEMHNCYNISLKIFPNHLLTRADIDDRLVHSFFKQFEINCHQLANWFNLANTIHLSIRETLQISGPIKSNETFYSLGGNSLLLVKLRRILEKKLNVQIDIIKLIENLKVEQIIQLCEELLSSSNNNSSFNGLISKSSDVPNIKTNEQQYKQKSIVLQQLYATPNVFDNPTTKTLIIVFFHALIGGNLSYLPLQESLKKYCVRRLIILGVQHPETFYSVTDQFPKDSLIELTKYYAETLENFLITQINLKEANIVFIGASLGATIAYEVYKILRDVVYIDLMISIDGNAVFKNIPLTKEEHATEMLKIISKRSEICGELIHPNVFNQMIENSWHLLQLRFQHFNTILNEITSYNSNFCPIRIILLKARDEISNENDSYDLGWSSLGANILRIDTIVGDHLSMLDPKNCDVLAQNILQYCFEFI